MADAAATRVAVPGWALGLLGVEALLVALHFSLPASDIVNLDREHNLPSWLSSLQLAALGAASFLAWRREEGLGHGRWIWLALTAGFLFLSFDESAVVHEGVLREATLQTLEPASLLRAVPPWQLVFAPAAVLAAAAFGLVLATRLAAQAGCLGPALAGLALWGASFVFEGTATGFFIPREWYQIEVAAEELCEMAGATLLLLALARYAASGREGASPAVVPVPRALAWGAPLGLLVALPAVAIAVVVLAGGGEAIRHASGERLLEDGRFAEAVTAFEAVLTERPDDLTALRSLGTSAYRAGDLDLAEQTFARVVAIAPEDQAMRNALSLVRVKKRTGR
jgi:hypothetical protein